MKYCRDCRYCVRNLWCNFPNEIDIVTGKPKVKLCHFARNNVSNLCGVQAKWFEKKEEEVPQSFVCKIISWFK